MMAEAARAHDLRGGRAARRVDPGPREPGVAPGDAQPARGRGPVAVGAAGAGEVQGARRTRAERLAVPADLPGRRRRFDTNVPVVEAEQVVDSLKKRGVPVEYILFPDEGHGWRKITNRVRSTVALVEFFSRYLSATGPSR